MKMVVRIFMSLLVAMLVPIGFWVSGWNFERGEIAGLCYVTYVAVFGMTVICPIWDELL